MTPSLRRIAFAAFIALSLGLSTVVVLQGFSDSTLVKLLETLAVCVVGAAALGGAMMAVGFRMAGWQEPESEEEFERVVRRAERLASQGTAAEPDETEFMDLDPYDDADFEELVSDALDELPDLLREQVVRTVRHELAHHVGFDELGVRDLGL